MPILLWSTVVNQLEKPVVAVGRCRKPRRASCVTSGSVTTVAMGPPLWSSLQALQVLDDGIDLILGQLVREVRHVVPGLAAGRVVDPQVHVLGCPHEDPASELGPAREVRE